MLDEDLLAVWLRLAPNPLLAHFVDQPARHGHAPPVALPVEGQPLGQQAQLHQPPVGLGLPPADGALGFQGAENGVHLGFQNAGPAAEAAGGQAFAGRLGGVQQAADHGLVEGQAGDLVSKKPNWLSGGFRTYCNS